MRFALRGAQQIVASLRLSAQGVPKKCHAFRGCLNLFHQIYKAFFAAIDRLFFQQ
jgi:hypothetical protein